MVRKKFAVTMGGIALLTLQVTLGLAADNTPNPFVRPEKFTQGVKAVYGVWYEDDGTWHLRVTSKEGRGKARNLATFTGSVRVNGGSLSKVEPQSLLKKYHTDRQGFDFHWVTAGFVTGVKFKVEPKAESITFKLSVDGDEDRTRIWIGKNGAYPAKAEFTLPARPKK